MRVQDFSAPREVIVAEAIRPVVSELRMVEASDYIAFIRMELFGNVADLIETAAEQYFMPGVLRMGIGGQARAGWGAEPEIELDLELHPGGVSVYFTLGMRADSAFVRISYITFENNEATPEENTRFLESALLRSRFARASGAPAVHIVSQAL
ncbi:hypothetical protein [Limoniibacter endophyticus]|uniref:Uncharacterized protein n=1 Tax=Limoniibacter endophyticus TaxID=1565040 RepID=A0A8J3GGF8_9HYPH|nr:hypothetical protein [Limoniibacter endophyticus]GHC64659.1 hypothetical protein GCM10010136_06760 [Limoniibacter endophyticus]